MAWIKKINGKKGTSYQIKVAEGYDSTGRQVIHTRTWRPASDMTEKQEQKALAAAVEEFEQSIKQGYHVDGRQTFEEYANYVISTKEQAGLKKRTIERYRELMTRITPALGHKKLTAIRPAHLNLFYENLSEEGIRSDGERYTLKADLAGWMKENDISKSELSRRAGIASATVRQVLDGKPVSLVTAGKVADAAALPMNKAFTKEVNRAPLSKKTILEYHRFISSVFSMALKEMLVPYNPASRATPPKVKRKTPAYYQPDEVDRILDAVEDEPLKWKLATYLLIDTGCRRGEIAGLKWTDVDWENGIILIGHALLYTSHSGTYEDTTKSDRERALRLAPETMELLRLQKQEQERMKSILGERWVDEGFVFTKEMGGHMNPDSMTQWLAKFSKRKGLPHIHPHAFRHTAASTMIAEGVDLVTAANELGHSDATVTATIYAHQIALAKAKASTVRSSAFRHREEKKRAVDSSSKEDDLEAAKDK